MWSEKLENLFSVMFPFLPPVALFTYLFIYSVPSLSSLKVLELQIQSITIYTFTLTLMLFK